MPVLVEHDNISSPSCGLGIGAIFKNEAPYVLEWLAFHRAVGFTQFFIADNDSDDGTSELLAALHDKGWLVRIPYPTAGEAPQMPAYRDILKIHGSACEWIAFIDADEFLVPTGADSVSEHIATITDETVGAIIVNWAVYGSSGHETKKEGLVTERFTMHAPKHHPTNNRYKSLVRPPSVSDALNPHHFALKPDYRAVMSDGSPLQIGKWPGRSAKIIWSGLRINHYITKSREEFFERKLPRGRATLLNTKRPAMYFKAHDHGGECEHMAENLLIATRENMRLVGRSIALPDESCSDTSRDRSPELRSDAREPVPFVLAGPNVIPSRGSSLGIGAIFKNEGPYILEWVALHRLLGVERFFIADNNSDDGTSGLLAALQSIGLVDHMPFPGVPGEPPQMPAYAEILRRYGKEADWIGFIDADEFLVPTDGSRSIRPIIERVADDVGQIVVNWAIYGSSFRSQPSRGLVTERFTRRARENCSSNYHYKSFVRPLACVRPLNPHKFLLLQRYGTLHADGHPLTDHPIRGAGLSLDVHWLPLRLNHYIVKSKAEFDNKKTPRGSATVLTRRKDHPYFMLRDRNDVVDPVPPWLVAQTKEEMERIRSLLRERGCAEALVSLDDAIETLRPRHQVVRPRGGHGRIDSFSVRAHVAILRGWALTSQNAAVNAFKVRIAGRVIETVALERTLRPDIVRKFPAADADAGFALSFSSTELQKGPVHELTLEADAGDSVFLLRPDSRLGLNEAMTEP